MEENPRVGLILLRSDWSGCETSQTILETIQANTQDLVDRLKIHFEVLGPWVVDSLEAMQACQHALRDAELDLVLLAFQTFAEDSHLVTLLQAIGSRPLVVWCYLPWRRLPYPGTLEDVMGGSGPVGTFGALGTLRNLNMPFLFTYGSPDDPRLLQDLRVAGRAAQVRQSLRRARFGLLPSRNERMQSTFVDEFRLMADFGPVVQYLSISELKRAVDSLTSDRVDAYRDLLRQSFPVRDISDETFFQAAQCTLGLASLAMDARLDVLAVNDSSSELARTFQMRPALYPYLLEPQNILFQPEGDLGAATANYILSRLTGSPTFFLELWTWDEPKNRMIGGHGGLQNPAIALPKTAWISSDTDYCRPQGTGGAQFQMLARPGRVTLFQLRSTPSGWQAIAASGVCLEGQPWIDRIPHAILRLDAPVEQFLKRLSQVGATQHWIMAYGSVLAELEAFCTMEKIPFEELSY